MLVYLKLSLQPLQVIVINCCLLVKIEFMKTKYFSGWLFGLTFVDQNIDKEIILESSNIILNDEKQKVIDIR